MKRYILAIGVMLCGVMLHAQIPMGEWRTHFSYNGVGSMVLTNDRLFALSSGALISIDKRDETVEYYSRMTGLNGKNIAAIQYSEQGRCLVVAYADGNIDLLTDAGVYNISDFYTKTMTDSKTANSIFCRDGRAYLCCPFGIVCVDLKRREIAETYYIGENAAAVNVFGMAYCNGRLYAATADALYSASPTAANLMNFESWTKDSNVPEPGQPVTGFCQLNGHLWMLQGGHVYQRQPQETTWSSPLPGWSLRDIVGYPDRVLLTNGQHFFSESTDGETCHHLSSPVATARVAYDASRNDYWMADDTIAVLHADQTSNYFAVNGPFVNDTHFMKFFGDVLYATDGYLWAAKTDKPGKMMVLRDDTWGGIPYAKLLQDAQTLDPNCDVVVDASGVAVDPLDANHLYVSLFGAGLFEYRYQNGQYVVQNFYSANNHGGATVEVAADIPINQYYYTWVDSPIFDAQGNLWLCNLESHSPIKCLSPQGQWTNYNHSNIMSSKRIFNLFFDKKNPNYLWFFNKRSGAGIGVIDTKGTPHNTSDDQVRFFTRVTDQDGNEWTFSSIYCAVQDQMGYIWVATDIGPLRLNYLQNPITEGLYCYRGVISRNDGTMLGDYLLNGVRVNAIAVDGGNRKWFGTEGSGLFLFEDNCMMELAHFTSVNSPLVSNSITTLAIHPRTGELFIGTGNGIMSYQADASESSRDLSDIYAYPNPVHHDFRGLITIKGLVDDCVVKITDAAGNLVCETRSNGGIAVWNGCNIQGRRVSSGVYYAICFNQDGSLKGRTRMLVM